MTCHIVTNRYEKVPEPMVVSSDCSSCFVSPKQRGAVFYLMRKEYTQVNTHSVCVGYMLLQQTLHPPLLLSVIRFKTCNCGVSHYRDKYRFYACLLRARFDENKNEKDMVKATKLLKAGEEEFWAKQHPQPYIFPDSPGGTSYERYNCYKVPEWVLDHWHPSEKAMYPDYFSKREQWKKLREKSWDKEVAQLQAETPAGGPRTEALPPARKEGDLPPLWWQYVTRPKERPA
uniref:NADH dehydrogenase [ubiquinone] 1 beta subcomplex subunit 9 n=1 Tax=Monopterus albus TaxID=43700 RepID=A0A3Q3JJH1_MONAL